MKSTFFTIAIVCFVLTAAVYNSVFLFFWSMAWKERIGIAMKVTCFTSFYYFPINPSMCLCFYRDFPNVETHLRILIVIVEKQKSIGRILRCLK